MIVKHHEEGWEIISHYAHGLLSGKIAHRLKASLKPKNWIDVLTGIIEHDDHLLGFDEQSYLLENGTPKDFTMGSDTHWESLEHAKRVYGNAMQKSQLVALMTGRHLEFLYRGIAQEYAPIKNFLKSVSSIRKVQRELYGINAGEEDALYDIVLFSDRCSLVLCKDEVPNPGRKIEINHTIGNKTYFMEKRTEDKITVAPWPFENSSFEIDVEYRILKKVAFKDNRDLEKSLQAAEVQRRTFAFEK